MSDYRVEIQFEHIGYKCVVIMMNTGYRCGYVGVDKSHPLYGAKFNEHCEVLAKHKEELINDEVNDRGVIPLFLFHLEPDFITPSIFFDVHGSVTYTNSDDNDEYPIQSDLWWFGFDCAHAWDAKILDEIDDENLREIYSRLQFGEIRSLDYCIAQCEKLAEQLLWVESREKVEVGEEMREN